MISFKTDHPEVLQALHDTLLRCPIENFSLNGNCKNEAFLAITARFLDGLNVKERCLYSNDFSKNERCTLSKILPKIINFSHLAMLTIKRLNMNKISLSHAGKWPLESVVLFF